VTTQSAHYIAHAGLRNAISDYLRHERRDVARAAEYLEEHLPLRKDEAASGD
jgi:predicted N-acyltransferase